ncbi:MAG: hypothetical protein PHW56_11490 [Methanosarcinaceae archaeon]|nr:hypothetical protein [Methanosarcinaceae archaeon]
MDTYLIESPHTAEECLGALDDLLAMGGPAVLEQYHFGCMVGVHTGWAIVNAESEAKALEIVPDSLRSKARAIKVSKFTADQIKEAHREMEEVPAKP